MDGPEEILLDMNEIAKGKNFAGLGTFVLSDDQHLLAYSVDYTGYRQHTLQVKDLRTGQTLPDTPLDYSLNRRWILSQKLTTAIIPMKRFDFKKISCEIGHPMARKSRSGMHPGKLLVGSGPGPRLIVWRPIMDFDIVVRCSVEASGSAIFALRLFPMVESIP